MKKEKKGNPPAGPGAKSLMEEPTRYEFETFREFDNYTISTLTSNEPSTMNGWVRVRKWRITAELVEEPKEVIAERIQHLWDICDNYHNWEPLKRAAAKIGYAIQGFAGTKARAK